MSDGELRKSYDFLVKEGKKKEMSPEKYRMPTQEEMEANEMG
jgi:hypothetical protein